MAKPRTLYDKIWDDHLIAEAPNGASRIRSDGRKKRNPSDAGQFRAKVKTETPIPAIKK